MATAVQMTNQKTGIVKQGFFGFSWTYLFFGWFVPLFRGHYSMAGIHFLIAIVSAFTLGIPQLILAFMFNKFYTLRLLEDGYTFSDPDEALVQRAKRTLGLVL